MTRICRKGNMALFAPTVDGGRCDMKFTAAELEEMRRADAEIEAEFRLTNDDLQLSRRIDRDAVLEDLPKNKRKLAEHQRAYREANREKVAE